MKYCIHCGQSLADNAVFCSSCGNKQETMSLKQPDKFHDQTIETEIKNNSQPNPHEAPKVDVVNMPSQEGKIELESAVLNDAVSSEAKENNFQLSPFKGIILTIGTFLFYSITSSYFEFRVNQLRTYIMLCVLEFVLIMYLGAILSWKEVNGKTTAWKWAIGINALTLIWVAFCFLGDLYAWIFY